MLGDYNLNSPDTIKVALIGNIFASYSTNELADLLTWDQISEEFEVTGTGYTAGGKYLSNNNVVQDDDNNVAKLQADNLAWAASSISARGAVLYEESSLDIIAILDFGDFQTSVSGTFTIVWSNSNVLYFL